MRYFTINHQKKLPLTILNKFHPIFLCVLFLILSTSTQAKYVPASLDSLISVCKTNVYDLRFKAAETTFLEIQSEYPTHPHGYVLQAYISMLAYALDQSNKDLEERLQQEYSKALKIAEDYKDDHPKNPDSYFQMAIATGIEGVYHIINRSFVNGFFSGRSTKKNLLKTIEMDSTYHDAYFGLGLFHYYADLLPGVMKFFAGVFGFPGDRVRGKKEINTTYKNGHHYQLEGEFLFHSIGYFLEGLKSNSIKAIEQLYARHPSNQAFGLMIAYHYRRSGHLQKCIDACQNMTDEHSDLLPQLTNLRYYNTGVCYFDLNEFSKADSVLNHLQNLPTRKSPYYQAGINYYLGLMADLRGNRKRAEETYDKIKDIKQAQYWYQAVQYHIDHPADRYTKSFIMAENLLGSRQFKAALDSTIKLQKQLMLYPQKNKALPFLVDDLLARIYFFRRQLKNAEMVYKSLQPKLKKLDDSFRWSWIYLYYHRVLRDLKRFDEAEKMLNKSSVGGDSFTQVIIERDKFILEKRREQFKKLSPKK